MSNDELAQLLAVLTRLAVAQERSNQLMEESNKINVAAIGLQQQMHDENVQSQGRYMERLEHERVRMRTGGTRD